MGSLNPALKRVVGRLWVIGANDLCILGVLKATHAPTLGSRQSVGLHYQRDVAQACKRELRERSADTGRRPLIVTGMHTASHGARSSAAPRLPAPSHALVPHVVAVGVLLHAVRSVLAAKSETSGGEMYFSGPDASPPSQVSV